MCEIGVGGEVSGEAVSQKQRGWGMGFRNLGRLTRKGSNIWNVNK